MKLVSRYLLRHLGRPWVYVMAGFSLVAILVDLFGNFVDFMDAGTPLADVVAYYVRLLATYWPYLLPISLLLALLYALWQLGKNAELTAMRASGLSLGQLILPYVTLGLLATAALLGINELYNPGATYRNRQFLDSQGARRGEQTHLAPNLAYKNPTGRRLWRINPLDPRPASSYEMLGVNLTQQRPDGSDEYRLDAARARWVAGHWWFENVETRYFDVRNDPTGPIETSPSVEMTMLSETPKDFINEIKDDNERSAYEILQFIESHPGISKETRNRLMVDFHYRLAAPWLCLIVILVGVPFGFQTGRRGMGLGILFALLAFFGYYVLMGLGLAFGKQQLIPPAVAGWLPNAVFFLLGLVLLRRIR
jgi:lipopolysaccharide export system permease protein